MIDQLKNLEMYLLIIFCITVAITPFSVKNYLLFLFAKTFKRATYSQSTLGMFIDWMWLSSTVFFNYKT